MLLLCCAAAAAAAYTAKFENAVCCFQKALAMTVCSCETYFTGRGLPKELLWRGTDPDDWGKRGTVTNAALSPPARFRLKTGSGMSSSLLP